VRAGGLLVVFLAACTGATGSEWASCDADVEHRDWAAAARSCARAYERSGDPDDGIALAQGRLWSGNPEGAAVVARALIASPRAGDAFAVLGAAAAHADDRAAVLTYYGLAFAAHDRAADATARMRDAHALAGAWLQLGDVARAAALLELARRDAAATGDVRMEVFALVGLADLARQRGATGDAEAALERALALAPSPEDRRWILFKRGILRVTGDQLRLGRRDLEAVVALGAQLDPRDDWTHAAHLNLAWLDRLERAFAASHAHLDVVEATTGRSMFTSLNRGLVLADEGRHAEAAAQLDAAAAETPTGEWSWWVPFNRGEVAVALGDPDGAAAAYRRAIDAVIALVGRAGEHAPEVAASHRQPFVALFDLHARAGRWRDALGLVVELDLRSLIRSEVAATAPLAPLAEARPLTVGADGGTGDGSDAAAPGVDAVLAAWRGRPLVILVPAATTMWRLAVTDGEVTGEPVGTTAELEAHADALRDDPTAAAAARALGDAIVPAALAGHPLDVLLVGPIARAPLAAVLRGDELVVATTPLARVLGVVPRGAGDPAGGRGGAVVLGDPTGTLPSARTEATRVAAVAGVTARLGPDATATALRAAAGADLLHVAAHADLEPDGARLRLADRAVAPAELAALAPAPRLVVLASCGAAAARDDAGWGSLAAGFLVAGAGAVIAPAWSIDDQDTLPFVIALYDNGVRTDPVGAVARTQTQLRTTLPARAWAGFTVLRGPP
jgi:tetratricopeptide (TPR) repeat protein